MFSTEVYDTLKYIPQCIFIKKKKRTQPNNSSLYKDTETQEFE